jgi:uncharacterized protein YdhG (YjbR/CyaY superfamily)
MAAILPENDGQTTAARRRKMPKSKEVSAYIQEQNPERRTALEKLRRLVLETVPHAVETMEYRMPTYDYAGDMLCAFASQKHYMSLYMDTDVVDKHKNQLQGLDIGKSCIRFKRIEALPLDEVKLMLKETVQKRQG